jgi:hypothetical protein
VSAVQGRSLAAQIANPAGVVLRLRRLLRRPRRDLEWMWGLRGLRPRVLLFQWRARQMAWRTGDLWSIDSVTRPDDTRALLAFAAGCKLVVELGTGTAWTAVTLALDDSTRRVVSYDIPDAYREMRAERYMNLVSPDVRDRIELVVAPGSIGPREPGAADLLYIDSSHEREQTIEEVRAWQPHLREGALVIFDDYTNTDFPGIREAIEQLGLQGERQGKLFIQRHHNA